MLLLEELKMSEIIVWLLSTEKEYWSHCGTLPPRMCFTVHVADMN